MRNRAAILYSLLAGSILLFAGILLAQNAPDRPLIVNGKAQGMAVQMGGHSYVDIETVAQFTNGSVTIEPTRIVLNFPQQNQAAASGEGTAAPPPPKSGISRNFASLAIGLLAEMREWRGAVGTILTYGVPVVGTWPADYHDHVDADLRQVELAANTADDHDALQLVENEFTNLSAWADNVVSTRQNMNATNTTRPDVIQNDTSLAKISNCARFLNSMLVSGSFADDPSCH